MRSASLVACVQALLCVSCFVTIGDVKTGDAGASDAAGGGAFCAGLSPRPDLCLDFDDTVASSVWADPFTMASDRPLSAPRFARFSVTGRGANYNATSEFFRSGWSKVRIRFAARKNNAERVQVLFVGFDNDTFYYVTLDNEITVRGEVQGAPGPTFSTGLRTPAGEWVGLDFVLDLSGSTYALAAGAPGTPGWTNNVQKPLLPNAGRVGGAIQVGVQFANGPSVVDIDNLAIDVE